MRGKAPAITRMLGAGIRKIDWQTFTDEQVIDFRQTSDRRRAGTVGRLMTGSPDRRARIDNREIHLPGRNLTVRVHAPNEIDQPLPLILQFHGGGFVIGSAAQGDWVNSYVAVRCEALVVSVDYRLAPEHRLPAAIEDGFDALTGIVSDAAQWDVDPARVAVFGESAGAMIAAHTAIRARDAAMPLRAQVLCYPVTDWTDSMLDYPAAAANADNPMSPLPMLRAYRRFSLPSGQAAGTLSPLLIDNLDQLPPTLIQTANLDPLEDHGRLYAERLRQTTTDVQLTNYPRALHAFLNMPRLMSDAGRARVEIADFLRRHLTHQ